MNWQTVVAIISLCVTAIITVLGWSAANYYATIRGDRSRQIEYEIERCDRQIEEFYGPLYNLVRQIVNVFNVKEEIFKKGEMSPERRGKVEEYVKEHFFFPLHDEALMILRTRMHLTPEVPESLWKYLKHVTQERVRHELAVRAGVQADINWEPWPGKLWDDLQNGLDRARARQEELLQAKLRHAGTRLKGDIPIGGRTRVP